MKGVILAGGRGERLFPITRACSKQLLPVYDKPMIYYPLCTLMEAGVREVLVITRPEERARFEALLGDGGQWGLSIGFAEQAEPGGIAEAPLIAAAFIGADRFALALGDNIFCGEGFAPALARAAATEAGAVVLARGEDRPERYGVLAFDGAGRPGRIVEKPAVPPSRFAVTGLYFYDADAVAIARRLRPSARGELEIADLNNAYLEAGRLRVEILPDSVRWLDMGTPDGLLEAARLVAAAQRRPGERIGMPEAVAYRLGLVDARQVERLAARYGDGNAYGDRLRAIAAGPPDPPALRPDGSAP